MSNLISHNYRAGESLDQGAIVAFSASSPIYDPEVVKATVGSHVIGVCKQDAAQGDVTAVYSIIDGQYQPVQVTGSISAGDRLAINASGNVVKYEAADGVEQLPLVAMTAGTDALVDCVGSRIASGAIDGDLEVAGDLDVSGDVTVSSDLTVTGAISGKLAKLGDTAAGYSVGSNSQPVYFSAGVPTACTDMSAGASFDVDSDGLIPVGSYGLVTFRNGGTTVWNVSAGGTIELTSLHAAKVPVLVTSEGSGSSAPFYQATGGDVTYPETATFIALTALTARASTNALALVKRTA